MFIPACLHTHTYTYIYIYSVVTVIFSWRVVLSFLLPLLLLHCDQIATDSCIHLRKETKVVTYLNMLESQHLVHFTTNVITEKRNLFKESDIISLSLLLVAYFAIFRVLRGA